MTKHTETFDTFDIVSVPFPFSDFDSQKTRPALILSSNKHFNNASKASVMAMITTATHDPWPLDVPINDLKTAGLPVSSIIRMKLFTLDHRLVLRKIGALGVHDRKAVVKVITQLIPVH